MAQTFLDNLPGLIGFVLLLVIGGLALYWIAMALAIGGLPGRRMTPDRAIGAGLRTIVLGILYLVVAVPAMFALVALGLVAGDAAIWLLLLFIPAVMFGFAFVAIRLSFALYAIFDGVGIVDSLRLSWTISRGAMLRILGWLAGDRRDLVRDLDRDRPRRFGLRRGAADRHVVQHAAHDRLPVLHGHRAGDPVREPADAPRLRVSWHRPARWPGVGRAARHASPARPAIRSCPRPRLPGNPQPASLSGDAL